MEVIKKKTVFKVFFFLAYLVLSFVFRKFIFVGSYKESILMVHLCFIAVYLITFNNDIMKHECYKKKLDISITTIVIALFPLFIYGIYEFIRDLYLPHNFLTTNYDTANLGFFVELLDFIFLYRAYGFDIGSLAIIDAGISLMSIVMVSQEDYSKREKSGKFENTVLNVARKLGKMYFKYRFFIVFLISICMAPQNYIFIRRLSYIIIAASLVYGLVSIYIYIKSIYEIEKYSKNKKLVLLVTLDNFDDNLLYEKNMLKQFFKYRLEKSLNNLSIETSRFVIARYELVRNRLINLKDYKDVSYLICYENKKINDLTIDTIKNFESEIEKIAKNSEKFAILEINDYNGKNHFTKIMKDKYKEDFKVNVAFETVLEDLLEKEENVYLKNSVENIINEIEQKMR